MQLVGDGLGKLVMAFCMAARVQDSVRRFVSLLFRSWGKFIRQTYCATSDKIRDPGYTQVLI